MDKDGRGGALQILGAGSERFHDVFDDPRRPRGLDGREDQSEGQAAADRRGDPRAWHCPGQDAPQELFVDGQMLLLGSSPPAQDEDDVRRRRRGRGHGDDVSLPFGMCSILLGLAHRFPRIDDSTTRRLDDSTTHDRKQTSTLASTGPLVGPAG